MLKLYLKIPAYQIMTDHTKNLLLMMYPFQVEVERTGDIQSVKNAPYACKFRQLQIGSSLYQMLTLRIEDEKRILVSGRTYISHDNHIWLFSECEKLSYWNGWLGSAQGARHNILILNTLFSIHSIWKSVRLTRLRGVSTFVHLVLCLKPSSDT